jgi:hypothetical protein
MAATETVVAVRTRPEPPAEALHDLFGAMRGSVTIAEGVDLTEPALDELFTTGDIDRIPNRDSGRRT